MKLSVIIPTYNSEKTIERTIQSITTQAKYFSDFEVICVDDGSMDHTWETLKKIAATNHLLAIYRQENKKQAAARNNGLKHASGDYVMFADADDYWSTDVFENILPSMNKKLTIFGIRKVYENKQIDEVVSGIRNSQTKPELIENYLTKNYEMDVGVWNKVFSKSVIDKNDLHFSNGNFFEDSLFVLNYLQVIQPSEINYIEKPLYILNKHTNTTTSSFSESINSRAENYYCEVEKIISKLGLPKNKAQMVLQGLKSRLVIHISHHYILHYDQWTPKWQHSYIAKNISMRALMANNLMGVKYKVALLMLDYCPRIYRNVYLRYKPEV